MTLVDASVSGRAADTNVGAADPGWFNNLDPSLHSCWQPVATPADLDSAVRGVIAVRLGGEQFVIARIDGELVAFEDRCPHRSAPLSAGSVCGSSLQCAYHGYRFDAAGRCVDIPALGVGARIPPAASVRPLAVTEHLGLIWLAPDGPVGELPTVPEFTDPDFTVVPIPVQSWSASALQMADNFLDVAHFPFTHRDTIGDPDDREVLPYEVVRNGWEFSVTHRHQAKSLADSMGNDGEFTTTEREVYFHCWAPHHVYLRITYLDTGTVLGLTFFHQAVDEVTTKLFCSQIRNDIGTGGATAEEAIEFQMLVGTEDRELLELLEPKAVPLDPRAEVHTRADKITLELRRLAADLRAATAT